MNKAKRYIKVYPDDPNIEWEVVDDSSMLPVKEQNSGPRFMSYGIPYESMDGPQCAYFKTTAGNTYTYETFAGYVRGVDQTSAAAFLWTATWRRLNNLTSGSRRGWIIIWRARPEISEDNGNHEISMRLAIIPADEAKKIIPLEAV